jgi:ligand-binding SRPBCC domain-containing protein
VLRHEGRLRVGGETWVEQTIAGFVPVVLGFRHTVLEAPLRFGEELIHGPFSSFQHLHEFEENSGKTLVRDLLDVEWPWQFGGNLALKRMVRPSIRRMFQGRAEAMERLAQDGTMERCAAQCRSGKAC